MMLAIQAGICLLIVIFGAVAAAAQSEFSAAFTVNGHPVSYFLIDQRVALLTALGAPEEGLQDEAIKQVTDDVLKLQLAKRLGMEVSEADIDQGLEEFAAQRGATAEKLTAVLGENGVEEATWRQLIHAGLVWRQVVQGQFRKDAQPTGLDISHALNMASAVPIHSLHLAEIVLPFIELGPEETVAFAKELSDRLNAGEDFAEAARSYSRSGSAAEGGTLDWMRADELPDLIKGPAQALELGEVSKPILYPEGVLLIKLTDESDASPDLRTDVSVTWGEISLAGDLPALQARANGLTTCDDFRRLAAASGVTGAVTGPVPLASVPGSVGARISHLDAGEADVISTSGGASILFLCEKTPVTTDEAREQFRQFLFARRITALGEGLLIELRRDAVILQE